MRKGPRQLFGAVGLSSVPRYRRSIVVGGSLAGMLAARVLSGHFDEVIVLERDQLPGTPTARAGVPQARHAHALLDRGRGVIERLLPGLTEELVRAGAEPMDATLDVATMCPHGWYIRSSGGPTLLGCSRDLIDLLVRRRVAAIPNVRIRPGVSVDGLIHRPGASSSIAGVRLWARPGGHGADRMRQELAADLVVVADGRNTHLPEWLCALGYEPAEETIVNSFQGYASRRYRPPEGFKAEWKALYIQQAPPDHPRGGLIAMVEGGLWLVSLIGGDGHYPPVDEAGFLDFARNLRSSALYEAIIEAQPLTPIVGQRATENRLRHYERLRRFPEGLLVLGDAACAFNPVYGQGMTAAAIGAEELGRWLQGTSSHRGRGRTFQRSLARATSAAWQLSTGADYRFQTTEGTPQEMFARWTGRYLVRVMQAATRRPSVVRRLSRVFHLLRPPTSLFAPGVLAGLAWDRLVAPSDTSDRESGPSASGRVVHAVGPTADLDVSSAAVGRS